MNGHEKHEGHERVLGFWKRLSVADDGCAGGERGGVEDVFGVVRGDEGLEVDGGDGGVLGNVLGGVTEVVQGLGGGDDVAGDVVEIGESVFA